MEKEKQWHEGSSAPESVPSSTSTRATAGGGEAAPASTDVASAQEVHAAVMALDPAPKKALRKALKRLLKAGWTPGAPLGPGMVGPRQSVAPEVWRELPVGVRAALGGEEEAVALNDKGVGHGDEEEDGEGGGEPASKRRRTE